MSKKKKNGQEGVATKPERAGMRMGIARPPCKKKYKEGTEGAPHSTTDNMDRRGWALARAWAQGGGKPYPLCKQKKKNTNRVAANLERTGSGTGMSIADG